MNLYRCQNEDCSDDPHGRLIFDFENDVPVCPKCSADARTPYGTNVVIVRVPVHLHVKDPAGPIITPRGRLRVACSPDASKLPRAATGVPVAATCPACRETDAFKKLNEQMTAEPVDVVAAGTPLGG